jgi:hypothetical protein
VLIELYVSSVMNGSGFDSYVIYVIDQLLCLLHFF